ncbi:MAG: hypothetical protein QM541_09990 [Flavobacterium sp.]|nr:hypothetical protein [Flavobacterium sp.]
MKRLILSSVSVLCIVISASANEKLVNHKDTAQLKQRIEYLEKQVASLDSQMKALNTKVVSSQPTNNTPKKMVIERRGSKQVKFE